MMAVPCIDDDQDSFVVLDETPEETIGQLSLENLTVDQAVYTIGTLTQRIEQLTTAMAQSSMARSAKELNQSTYKSSSFQEVRTLRPQATCSVQTEYANGVDECVSVAPVTASYLQQTSLVEQEMPTTACLAFVSCMHKRETISDLQTAMERLSAEKVSYLTCLAERDRRLNAAKEELRKAKTERAAMEEVLHSHAQALERTEMALSETRAELESKEKIVQHLEADLAASREEAVSLRFVAQMVMEDKDGSGAVMVDPDQPSIPSISYPYHSVPPDRRQF